MIMYANDRLSLKEIVKNNKVFSPRKNEFVSECLCLANAAITWNNNNNKKHKFNTNFKIRIQQNEIQGTYLNACLCLLV